MRGITHISIGVAGSLLLQPAEPLTMGAAVIGSLLPDIDEPNSLISRKVTPGGRGLRFGLGVLFIIGGRFYPLLYLIGAFFLLLTIIPHRGVTHSLLCWAVMTGIAYLLVPEAAISFSAGYFLHLVADLVTGGVPLFWPREKRVSLNLGKTGGLVDTLSLIGGIVIIGIKAVQVAKDYFVILTKNL